MGGKMFLKCYIFKNISNGILAGCHELPAGEMFPSCYSSVAEMWLLDRDCTSKSCLAHDWPCDLSLINEEVEARITKQLLFDLRKRMSLTQGFSILFFLEVVDETNGRVIVLWKQLLIYLDGLPGLSPRRMKSFYTVWISAFTDIFVRAN